MFNLRRLRSVWHPDEYHGWGRARRYFEGWYFKIVSADERHAMAVIPGVSMGADGRQHAFIQVMDGKAERAEYHRFPVTAFRPSPRSFEVWLGDNFFSGEKIKLELPDISGELKFEHTRPWPKMLGAPGIMGWYSFVPFMECNHGVVSLDHILEGRLSIRDAESGILRVADFSGGRGYIEKDWGRSFPRAYVWMQSNHFDRPATSLLASVAHIPWLNGHFIGFISGFLLEGTLFKFATYTGARKFLRIDGETLELVFRNAGSELRILAVQSSGTALKSPLSGEMTGKVQESLKATLRVELLQRGQRIFEGSGRNAGLEVAGAVASLQD